MRLVHSENAFGKSHCRLGPDYSRLGIEDALGLATERCQEPEDLQKLLLADLRVEKLEIEFPDLDRKEDVFAGVRASGIAEVQTSWGRRRLCREQPRW